MIARLTELTLAWVALPVLAALICVGLSGLVSYLGRRSAHIALDIPLGLAALIVVAQFTTAFPGLARVTVMAVVALAMLGFAVNPVDWREWVGASRRPLAFACATYVIYLSPVIVSARPTFLGWIKLDDGSTFMAFVDQLLTGGRTTAGLPQSTFEAAVQYNFDRGYPMGAFVPFGVLAQILRVDVAWVYQPYIAFLAATITLTAYVVLRRLVASTFMRGVFAVAATCSALLVGYAWWGGVKELTLVPILLLAVYFLDEYRPGDDTNRTLLPLAVTLAAFVSVFAPTGLAWFVLPLAYLVRKYQAKAPERTVSDTIYLMGLTAVMALPTFQAFGDLDAYKTAFTFAESDPDIGNLPGPLSPMQIAGIWPSTDFRYPPAMMAVTEVMVAFVIALAALAVLQVFRSEHKALAYVSVSTVAIALVGTRGNAWIAGKSLAVASTFVLLCAFVSVATFYQEKRQLEYFTSSSVIVVGLAWSLGLAYHGVTVAPYAQLRELEAIGQQFSANQPALIIEYNPYAARHFLRDLAAEGAGELRRRPVTMTNGGQLEKGAYADIDEFALGTIETYETLVLRRSPIASRPPANYALQAADMNYEVWQKQPGLPGPEEHIAAGSALDAGGQLACEQIKAAAQRATNGTRLVAALAPEVTTIALTDGSLPPGWTRDASGLTPRGSGTVTQTFTVSTSGTVEVWLRGWSRGRTAILVDGIRVGTLSQVLNQAGAFSSVGTVELSAGSHELTLAYSAPWWMPGVVAGGDPMGPVIVSPLPGDHTLVQVSPEDFASLCGKRLDWLEVAH